MKLHVLGRSVTISVEAGHPSDPMTWPRKRQRKFAHDIARVVMVGFYRNVDGGRSDVSDHKIGRIKVCRHLLRNRQDEYCGLKEAKRFVELAFAQGGVGNEVVI